MKREVAFRALNAVHAAASNAQKQYLVKSVTKSGAISKSPFSSTDWRLLAHRTPEEAHKKRADMEQMNPGSKFAVVHAQTGEIVPSHHVELGNPQHLHEAQQHAMLHGERGGEFYINEHGHKVYGKR